MLLITVSHISMAATREEVDKMYNVGFVTFWLLYTFAPDFSFPSEGNSTLRPLSRVALGTPPA